MVKYEEACRAEGVVVLRVHAVLEAGRAFCFTMAPVVSPVRAEESRCTANDAPRSGHSADLASILTPDILLKQLSRNG